MKRIISALLLFAMALSLFACGTDIELVKLDAESVSTVNCVLASGITLDKKEFIDAYNGAKVIKEATSEDKNTTDVLIFVLSDDKGAFTLYYMGDDRFAVTGTDIKTEYVIESEALATLYLSVVDPQPEFVKIDEVTKVLVTKAPDKTLDIDKVKKYYNESEFVGKATNENSSDVILLTLSNSEDLLLLTYVGDGFFRVAGTDCRVEYIIKSADLEALYTDALK